ncbi:MAG: adenylate cyclase [Thermodesulfobacteriota bacterium]|nr:adenylate cyclase [Thermodesulfobacteriota bacterium]
MTGTKQIPGNQWPDPTGISLRGLYVISVLAMGKPSFDHGISIHSGRVLAGNSGSEEQSAYALIGSTVNVASRIQGLTRELGCDILVSQETVERLRGSFPLVMESARFVKGYSRPIVVYRLQDGGELEGHSHESNAGGF